MGQRYCFCPSQLDQVSSYGHFRRKTIGRVGRSPSFKFLSGDKSSRQEKVKILYTG